jgi:hypothetical protein
MARVTGATAVTASATRSCYTTGEDDGAQSGETEKCVAHVLARCIERASKASR